MYLSTKINLKFLIFMLLIYIIIVNLFNFVQITRNYMYTDGLNVKNNNNMGVNNRKLNGYHPYQVQDVNNIETKYTKENAHMRQEYSNWYKNNQNEIEDMENKENLNTFSENKAIQDYMNLNKSVSSNMVSCIGDCDIETFYKDLGIIMRVSEEDINQNELVQRYVCPPYNWQDKSVSIHLLYPYFDIKQPVFINNTDKMLFDKNSDNLRMVGKVKLEKLLGQITLIRNGSVHWSYDCGNGKKAGRFLRDTKRYSYLKEKTVISTNYILICPLLVPDSYAFQEFLSGVLPKIAQMWPFIASSVLIKFVLYKPRDPIIYEILNKIGITGERVMFFDRLKKSPITNYIQTAYQINTCQTPPLHPLLWKQFRSILQLNYKLPESENDTLVILLARNNVHSFNGGRNIVNQNEVSSYLKNRYKNRYIEVYGGLSLDETVTIFGKASLIIGVHGGALFNIHFCPIETVIIEYMPTYSDGSVSPRNLAHHSLWPISSVIGQRHYRLTEAPLNDMGDVNINIHKLENALNKIYI